MLVISFVKLCIGEVNSPLLGEREDMSLYYKKVDSPDMLQHDEDEYPRENGRRQSNKIGMEIKSVKSAERRPDLVDDHPDKHRSTFQYILPKFLCFQFSFN